jgi:hypothetical protein
MTLSGFPPNTDIELCTGRLCGGGGTTDGNGRLTISVQLPIFTPKDTYRITASGGGSSASASFTVN